MYNGDGMASVIHVNTHGEVLRFEGHREVAMRDRGLGICVIGRNESARLGAALSMIHDRGEHRVYVDSCSTDDSVAVAESFDGEVDVLQCSAGKACTAALGRNIGFKRLRERIQRLQFVQFIDGDCVLAAGWLERAMAFMREHPDVGIVAGRLREEDRDRNVYHRLADLEWTTDEGEVDSVGGICMVRADLFDELGGMNPAMAQGEEAELAARVRERGYKVVRLPDEMARHDIAIDHFGQWWSRAAREGKSAAGNVHRNGISDHESVRHMLSILVWGAGVPTAAVALLLPSLGLSMGLLGSYSVLWRRVHRSRSKRGATSEDAALYASATVLGKLANVSGVASYVSKVARARVWARLRR